MAFGRQLLQVCERCANGVRMVCEIRTPSSGVRKFRTPHAWCEFCSVFADSTLDIFFCIFWCNFLSSPCNKPITSFCFCKDYIRGGNHLLRYIIHITFYTLSFSLFSSLFYFLGSQTASKGFSSEDDWLKLLVSQSMDVMWWLGCNPMEISHTRKVR